MDPPLTTDVGSTVRTATRCPASITLSPSISIKVDFPTPGTPVIPIRNGLPTSGNKAVNSDSAWSRWDERVDSKSVIERASARRSRVYRLLVCLTRRLSLHLDLKLNNRLIRFERITDGSMDRFNNTITFRLQDVFHFHRFDDSQRLTRMHGVACLDVNRNQ